MADQELHVDKERARAGQTRHIVRYVLAISLTLVVLGMLVVLLVGQR